MEILKGKLIKLIYIMKLSFYFILLACTLSISPLPSNISSSSWNPDYWPTNEWETSTPGEQGMQDKKMQEMDDYLDSIYWSYRINSLLVVRNGYIVYERYLSEQYKTIAGDIASVNKAIISSLMGICLQEGYVNSLEDFVLDYFPNVTFNNMSPMKERMKIKHLLTMTSGLDWESPDDSTNPIERILNKPMISEPGDVWDNDDGCSHVLSAIINNVSGIGTANFTENSLFNPLGINEYSWVQDDFGIPQGGWGLHLIPRDMARFGFLYLNDGNWNGTQLISEEYVETATRTHIEIDPFIEGGPEGYGYNWYISKWKDSFWVTGAGGQHIIVIPNKNLVIVGTGTMHFPITELIDEYILPATSSPLIPWIIGGSCFVVIAASGISFSILKKRKNKQP